MKNVELPYAPVDTLVRESVEGKRVSREAAEKLALEIQERGAAVSEHASHATEADGRKTIRPQDYGFDVSVPSMEDLTLPVAPVDRIARLRAEDFRVSKEARLALTLHLEDWARDVASGAGKLAEHADRRTVLAEDVDTYIELTKS